MKNKKLFLLDMDGTLYIGDKLFADTPLFLDKIKSNGGKYVFLTNNSSKSTDKYVQKLATLGIHASSDDFLSSTDATIVYIKSNYPDVKFYCMGTASFQSQLGKSGIKVTDKIEQGIGGVIISNDTELSFKKLNDVCEILTTSDVVYIATNPDWTCPTEYGFVPDCGSFADIIHRATGKKPYFIGKPRPDMIYLAMDKFGYSKNDTVMIGDRIYTDIASGANAGIDTILVLSGESNLLDAETSDIKPTYVFDSISDILNLI